MKLDGDKIIELIGLPDYDDGVLDLLDALEEDRETISDNIEITEEKYGIILGFNDFKLNKKQRADTSGAMFLNAIEFYPNFEHLPLGLDANDSYDEVVQKLGQEANFISKERDDAHYRYWFFKERGYILWFMLLIAITVHVVIQEKVINIYYWLVHFILLREMKCSMIFR